MNEQIRKDIEERTKEFLTNVLHEYANHVIEMADEYGDVYRDWVDEYGHDWLNKILKSDFNDMVNDACRTIS